MTKMIDTTTKRAIAPKKVWARFTVPSHFLKMHENRPIALKRRLLRHTTSRNLAKPSMGATVFDQVPLLKCPL